ncbi:hypothetical protein BJX61DRAFT_539358 [Aspergillus egyptiacus]|nr:hypothetical protein BJX61DRAFT_539358 [Aspergillus egyptiacus]
MSSITDSAPTVPDTCPLHAHTRQFHRAKTLHSRDEAALPPHNRLQMAGIRSSAVTVGRAKGRAQALPPPPLPQHGGGRSGNGTQLSSRSSSAPQQPTDNGNEGDDGDGQDDNAPNPLHTETNSRVPCPMLQIIEAWETASEDDRRIIAQQVNNIVRSDSVHGPLPQSEHKRVRHFIDNMSGYAPWAADRLRAFFARHKP